MGFYFLVSSIIIGNILFKYIISMMIYIFHLGKIIILFFSDIQKINPRIFNTFNLEHELPSNRFVNWLLIPLKTSRYLELHSVSIPNLFFIKFAMLES